MFYQLEGNFATVTMLVDRSIFGALQVLNKRV